MIFTFFTVLLLFASPISQAKQDEPDIEAIYSFIRKHAAHSPKPNASHRSPFQKFQGAQVTRLADNLLQLDYEGFTVWLDCKRKGAVKFRYIAQRDAGRLKRYKKFHLDPSVPERCQQTSFRGYGKGYDRGHLVPANHLDHTRTGIMQSNFMTNILPQASAMNRGAWQRTEEIIECYRDIDDLLVIGGVVWGNDPADDYFVKSHGVHTPGAFWKVIIRGTVQDERAIAWIVPNSQEAKKGQLDRYLVSIAELERAIGESIPVADYAKHDKPSRSWLIPRGCNKG